MSRSVPNPGNSQRSTRTHHQNPPLNPAPTSVPSQPLAPDSHLNAQAAVRLDEFLSRSHLLHASELENDPRCTICSEPFLRGANPEVPVGLDCGHIFGMGCILKWLSPVSRNGNNSCPNCRKPVFGDWDGTDFPDEEERAVAPVGLGRRVTGDEGRGWRMRAQGSVALPVAVSAVGAAGNEGHRRPYAPSSPPRFSFPPAPTWSSLTARLLRNAEDESTARTAVTTARGDTTASTSPTTVSSEAGPAATVSAADVPRNEGHRRPYSPSPPPSFTFHSPPPRFIFPPLPVWSPLSARLHRYAEDESTAPTAATVTARGDATASTSAITVTSEAGPAVTMSAAHAPRNEGHRTPSPPRFSFPPLPAWLRRDTDGGETVVSGWLAWFCRLWGWNRLGRVMMERCLSSF